MFEVVKQLARPALKAGMYHFGPLRAYHRARNRNVLTVVIFHRVLARTDPRFAYCDPEYTMPEDLFIACLQFFKAHYAVVSLADVLESQLPEYPLLITFDDGWVDHGEVALPQLVNRKLPALAFIAGDAIEGRRPLAFWETLLIHGFRGGTLGAAELEALGKAAPGSGAQRRPVTDLPSLRRLIAALEELPEDQLRRVLAPLESKLAPGGHRHFLRKVELSDLARNGMALGGHGSSHAPLSRLADPAADLQQAHRELTAATGVAPQSMSFPHGRYTTEIGQAARAAGYSLLFTGDPVLNIIGPDGLAPTLGRIELPAEAVSDGDGRFRPEMLALRLFRARHERVSGLKVAQTVAQAASQTASQTAS
jgi:peptidoglycan/xylan/chitin deacetylase (PgdA/CDA1 family)